ncbi:MAG: glycosyl hydrolase 115 family protein, partial [Cellvibrio sp.]
TGTGWGGASIAVKAVKPQLDKRALQGFVEADGYIAIEAEHYQRQGNNRELRWEKIPEHGRTLSSMSVYPITDKSFTDVTAAPYLEYDFYSQSSGELKIEGLFAPSWPLMPGRGLRYAVAIDSEPAQIVDLTADMSAPAWEESVRSDVRRSITKHRIDKSGAHRLRIYSLDPGVTLQKILIDTGGLLPSYLGPEESRRY